jgi:thymidylate synthase
VYYSNNVTTVLPTLSIQATERNGSQMTIVYGPVTIIDLQENSNENFTCIKTKHLLHIVQITICLHDDTDAVSKIIRNERIWEEQYLIELFRFLIRYAQMSFIDVGANLGSYTMFTASFGRSVLSIECSKPNIDMIM